MFTLQPSYPRRMGLEFLFEGRMGVPQVSSEHVGERQSFLLEEISLYMLLNYRVTRMKWNEITYCCYSTGKNQ
jgi:hypothetical protein